MKSIRNLVARLSAVERTALDDLSPAEYVRRLVVPAAAAFSLDGTLLRTSPVSPVRPFDTPGHPTQIVQVLAWLDIAAKGESGPTHPEQDQLGADLAAILALATGRQVEFAIEVPLHMEGSPTTTFLPTNHVFDSELNGPVHEDTKERFEEAVAAVVALPEDKALPLGSAIRMRNAACALLHSDVSSAYGLLVVALETLSRAFGSPSTMWQDWDEADGWDSFLLSQGIGGKQASAIRERLISNRQIRLKRTFVDYALTGLTDEFWSRKRYAFVPEVTFPPGALPSANGNGRLEEEGTVGDLVPRDHAELGPRLRKSYDARSEVFHQSARLDPFHLVPAPSSAKAPLPFAGLRHILDYHLWREVKASKVEEFHLPDVKLLHQGDSTWPQ